MTLQQFLQLPEDEHNIFFAKLVHAALHYRLSWDHVYYAVVMADKKGIFDNVKFGDEVVQDIEFEEAIHHPTKGLLFFNHKTTNMITDPKEK